MGQVHSEVSTEEIARRAYEIWEARGRPFGDGSEDWNAAVAELASRRNGSAGRLRHWWERMRRSIVGDRDSASSRIFDVRAMLSDNRARLPQSIVRQMGVRPQAHCPSHWH